MVEQAIEDIGGVSCVRVDQLRMKRGILVGDVRVEDHTGMIAIFRVHVPKGFGHVTQGKLLTIGRRRCPVSPDLDQLCAVMIVDDIS